MKFKNIILAFFFCSSLYSQVYSDFVQLSKNDTTGTPVGILLSDGHYRYIIRPYDSWKQGEKLFYNGKEIYEFKEFQSIKYYKVLVIRIDEHNNFLSLFTFDEPLKTVEKFKFIDGELYYLAWNSKDYHIRKYVGEGKTVDVFSYTKGDRVQLKEFQKRGDELIVMGAFDHQPWMEIKGDTIWTQDILGGINNTIFLYCINMKNDSVKYCFGYGSKLVYTDITELIIDQNGNTVIYGSYRSEGMVILGDTLEYRGGYMGTDSYIARLNSNGELISTNFFSSESMVDEIKGISVSENGSYFIAITTSGIGEISIDGNKFQKSKDIGGYTYIVKFNNAGNLEWIDSIYCGGMLYGLFFESINKIYFGWNVILFNKSFEFNGESTILNNYNNEVVFMFFELDKESGGLNKIWDIVSNGKDIRLSGHIQKGDTKSIIFWAFEGNPIILNGDTIPTIGKSTKILVNVDFNTEGVIEQNTSMGRIELYPNPVSSMGEIQINDADSSVQRYRIYDVQGRQIQAGSLHDEGIPTVGLKSGTYILETIEKDGSRRTGKFIRL